MLVTRGVWVPQGFIILFLYLHWVQIRIGVFLQRCAPSVYDDDDITLKRSDVITLLETSFTWLVITVSQT